MNPKKLLITNLSTLVLLFDTKKLVMILVSCVVLVLCQNILTLLKKWMNVSVVVVGLNFMNQL